MLMCWNREYRLDRDLFGGSVVLRQWRITSTGRGCFANERLCSLRSFRFFSAHRLSKQVCSRQTKKAHRTQFGRLSLVAGTGEISNLDFLKDLSEVIDFASLDLVPNRNLPSSNIPFGKSIYNKPLFPEKVTPLDIGKCILIFRPVVVFSYQ